MAPTVDPGLARQSLRRERLTMSDPAAAEYVAARGILLDALEGLGSQRDAIIVVGAQAVYLQTGDAGIVGVSPYTTDADLVLAPTRLAAEPHIEELMGNAGFAHRGEPGVWWKTVDVNGTATAIDVDVMVPAAYAPAGGRRSVYLPPHDKMIARKVVGLEGSILDNDLLEVVALDDSDSRRFTVRVAGPAALVVAKVYKLRDRLAGGKVGRIADKDASDVFRLMQTIPIPKFLDRLRPLLADETAAPVCREALGLLVQLFGARNAEGVRMASDALRVAVPPERVSAICTSFVRDVGTALNGG